MTKSESTSPILLKRIDELFIANYRYLTPKDEVYYLEEYTTQQNFKFSRTNDLISNYKKEPAKKNSPEWKHKEKAIMEAASKFQTAIFLAEGISERIKNAILVPIPPSKAKESLEYDDRNLKLLKNIMPNGNIQEIILQRESRDAFHKNPKIRSPKELENNYYLDPNAQISDGDEVWLFDDLLTKGTHFRASCNILLRTFPKAKVVGFFIARSVYPF